MEKTKQRVLVFFQHNPYPPQTGAHQRCLAILKALKSNGCDVILYGTTFQTNTVWTSIDRLELEQEYGIQVELYQPTEDDIEYTKNIFGPSNDIMVTRRNYWGRYASPGLCRAFANFARNYKPHVVIVNYTYYSNMIDDPVFQSCLTILETLDLYSLSEQMQDVVHRQLPPVPVNPEVVTSSLLDDNLFQKMRLEAWPEEYASCDHYDISTVVSPKEHACIVSNTSKTKVMRVPITAEPEYLDNNYQGKPMFIAALNMVNVQAYLYFACLVFPIIRASIKDFTLEVIGSICDYFQESSGLEHKGYIQNIKDSYRNCPFAICPMLGATGQQIKVVEAMSMGVPVIIHKNVADSSPVEHGVNGFVAPTAEEFADYCLRLYIDRKLCQSMGEAARKTILESWSQTTLSSHIAKILQEVNMFSH